VEIWRTTLENERRERERNERELREQLEREAHEKVIGITFSFEININS